MYIYVGRVQFIEEEQARLTRKNEAGSQVKHPVYPGRQGKPSEKTRLSNKEKYC